MIVIKDMDMPENCFECRFKRMGWCGACEGNLPRVQSLDRPHWCPLGEMPDGLLSREAYMTQHRNPEDAHREDFGGASHE